MRLTEWFLVIPFLPLAIVLAAILGPSVATSSSSSGSRRGRRPRASSARRCSRSRQRDYVERSRALGASEPAPDDAPRPAERRAADPRQHDAHRADRDPVGGDARLPRPRRPVERLVGEDARRGLRGGRGDAAGVVVLSCRPASASCSWCSRSRCAGRRSRRSSTRGCGDRGHERRAAPKSGEPLL